jgi:4-nitrophenyl phosphatase
VPPIIIGKPQPDLVAKALKILGTPPATTFMLGDQVETDIVVGHLAGLQTILAKTGVQETGPFSINPDFEVDTLAKIPVTLSASKRALFD